MNTLAYTGRPLKDASFSGEFFPRLRFATNEGNIDMATELRALVKKFHAFYEVSPNYVSVEEKHGTPAARIRTIQAGFDVDIFGVNPNEEMVSPGADPDYALSYAGLQEIAEEMSHHTSGSCSLQVIPFPSKMVLGGPSHAQVQGMVRIRILHSRGLDQPAGPPEQQALEELEKQLHNIGLARGSRAT